MCDNFLKSAGDAVRNVTGKIADTLAPIDPVGSAITKRADEQTKHWDDTGTTKYIGAAALAYATAGGSLAATSGTAGATAGTATAGAATATGTATALGTAAKVAAAVKTGAGYVATASALNNVLNPKQPQSVTVGPAFIPSTVAVPQVVSQVSPTQAAPQAAAPVAAGVAAVSAVPSNPTPVIVAIAVLAGILAFRS